MTPSSTLLNPVFNWLDSKANPIAVKEVYQGFRSRAFMNGCTAALVISLLSFLVIATSMKGSMGVTLFYSLLTIIGLMAAVVIPYSVGTQLRDEILNNTMELLFITSLSPWEIISGRFQAAIIKMVLLFSYMGPFAFTAFLLGGVDALQVLGSLAIVFLIGMLGCGANLVINAIVIFSPRFKVLSILGQIIPILFFLLGGPSIVGVITVTSTGLLGPAIGWTVYICYALLALALTGFLLRVATDILTAPAIRSFTPSKLMLPAIVFLESVPVLAGLVFPSLAVTAHHYSLSSIIMLFMVMTMSLFWSGYISPKIKNRRLVFAQTYLSTMAAGAVCWLYLAFLHFSWEFWEMARIYLEFVLLTLAAWIFRLVLPVKDDSVIAYVLLVAVCWVLWSVFSSVL